MKEFLKRGINWLRGQYTISKLRVKDGDILIAKYKSSLVYSHDWTFWGDLRKSLDKRNMRDVQIMCLTKDCDLQSINEESMNRAGWFRKKENPGRDALLLNAYRELRRWDGYAGRGFSMTRRFDAEQCVRRLEGEL